MFTPNEDGKNDTFRIDLLPGSVLKNFSVYNRWGNEILTSNIVSFWDGRTTAGEPCTDGVYYYILQYTDPQNKEQNLRGHISLFR